MGLRGRRGAGADIATTRPVQEVFEATARLSAPREAAWVTLWDPRTARAIWPSIHHSVVLAGTGPGAGEIHVHVSPNKEGRLCAGGIVIEESRPPEYVRYISLGPVEVDSSSEITLDALDGRLTAVRWVMTDTWPAGVHTADLEDAATRTREYMVTYLRGSGRILDAPIDVDGCWRRS